MGGGTGNRLWEDRVQGTRFRQVVGLVLYAQLWELRSHPSLRGSTCSQRVWLVMSTV